MQVLITNIDQLKERLPSMMGTSLGIEEYRAVQTLAEDTYVLPYLGQETLDSLREYANGSDSDETLAELLEKVRDMTTPLLVFEALPSLEVKLSKAGLHQVEDDKLRPVYSIQRENLSNQMLKQGMAGLEALLRWLEAHASDLNVWAESPERLERKQLVVRTAREFTRHFAPMANKRATYEALLPTMQEVQDTVLRNVLGDDMYEALLIELETLSGSDTLSDVWQAVVDRSRPIVAKTTAARAMPGLSLSIEAWGVFSPSLMHNERNSKVLANADAVRYNALREQLEQGAEAAVKRLTDYLDTHYTDYPDLWPEPDETAPTEAVKAVISQGGVVML